MLRNRPRLGYLSGVRPIRSQYDNPIKLSMHTSENTSNFGSVCLFVASQKKCPPQPLHWRDRSRGGFLRPPACIPTTPANSPSASAG